MPSRDTEKQRQSEQVDAQESAAETVTPDEERAPRRRPRKRAASNVVAEAPAPDGEAASEGKRPRSGKRGNPARLVLPVLVSDEALLLPHMSIPLPIEDDETAAAVDRAMRMDPRLLLILTERKVTKPAGAEQVDRDLIDIVSEMIARENEETGEFEELVAELEDAAEADDAQSDEAFDGEVLEDEEYVFANVGVIAEIAQYISRPAGNDHIILQGVARGTVEQFLQDEPFIAAQVLRHDEKVTDPAAAEAAMTAVLEQVESYISLLPNVPEEVLTMVRSVDDPGWLGDLIAFSPEFSADQRQELLEILDPVERLHRLSVIIQKRINVLNLRHEIQSEAQAGMDKQQREYFLREQLRAINKELGEGSSDEMYATEMRKKIEAAGMPEEVRTKALVQVERLEQQHPYSPEIGVIRGYLEWLTELPWSVETEDVLDLDQTAKVLDEDHYGLDKVKERIVEYIAVRKLAGDKLRAPILCFVGPPGVGKTSLGRSIARAIGRNYVRMSLGGVRDEAEIRGHRRTYVGAMPGRVIKALRDAKSRNPVVVLDEIDKVGSDAFRGDPSSALLEVLDPEQNTTFSDHYLEVPFDLSKALFITTANMLDPIPVALRDRMEIIEVSGYTELEKLEIARQYLLPKSLESHGIKPTRLKVTDEAIQKIIREYTEESGVRNLEREIGSLCRKAARRFAGNRPPSRLKIDARDVQKYLGVPRYEFGLAEEKDEVGVTTGAAVTSVGGDLLSIEVILMDGKGDLMLTGQLGDVMQESARAALSYARSHASQYGLAPDFFDKHTIHVHIPAGAIPKDGPSAGITMATALISALTGVPVRKDVAMTGEVTLRGKVLPIGGLREKTLAAHRGGIKTFILPKRNAKDLAELPEVVRKSLNLIPVSSLDEVLEIALVHPIGAGAAPEPRKPAERDGRPEPALPPGPPAVHGPAPIRVASRPA